MDFLIASGRKSEKTSAAANRFQNGRAILVKQRVVKVRHAASATTASRVFKQPAKADPTGRGVKPLLQFSIRVNLRPSAVNNLFVSG
jgi:hypothetical protein